MNKALIPQEDDYNPLEIYDLDELLPSDDHAALAEQRLKREIEACARHLKPRFISAITMVTNGSTVASAGRKYHIGGQTIAKHMNSGYGLRFYNALRRLYALRDGTKYIQRELMLWRIAAANEIKDPRTSIAAIAEINRTKGDTPDALTKAKDNAGLQGQPTIIIQLADNRLKSSPLDELPTHMIKDVN